MLKNKEIIFLLFVVVAVGGYVTISKISEINEAYYNEFYMPILKFEKEQYREALIGDDTFKGFYHVMNDYRGWKNVDIVKFYTGLCLIKTKDHENGIRYLTNIHLRDPLMEARKYIFLGDTYADLNNYNEAIKHYRKATTFYSNDTDNVNALYKIILCYEKLQQHDEALKLTKETMGKYPEMQKYKEFVKQKTQLESIEQKKK